MEISPALIPGGVPVGENTAGRESKQKLRLGRHVTFLLTPAACSVTCSRCACVLGVLLMQSE